MADIYVASDKRYDKMVYNRVGKSGLKFPAVSLLLTSSRSWICKGE